MDGEPQPQPEAGTIWLDGRAYPATQVTLVDLAAFVPRISIGDSSRDSDDLLSSWIVSDLSGGGQVWDLNEASDSGRFWFATLHTPDPFLLTLNRAVDAVPAPNGLAAFPLGDLAGTCYLAFGSEIRAWDEATGTLVTPTAHTLASPPTNKAVAFAGKLYVPQGTGYQTFSGSAIAAQVTDNGAGTPLQAAALGVWDNKLYLFGQDGLLASSADGATWNVDLGPAASKLVLQTGETPRHLIEFYDRSGTPALHLITNRRAWAYDPDATRLYPTNLKPAPHPSLGKGVAVWQTGGDLYLSSGSNVYRYDGSVISEGGPARDNNLPAAYRGQIVDLIGESNGLYALIQGSTSTIAGTATAVLDETSDYDDPLDGHAQTAVSSLLYWTGQGWHTAWTGDAATGVPSWGLVSDADDAYRLWWGHGATAYTLALPTDFHNPRAGLQDGVDRFEAAGYLETGWFDANMAGFDKLAADVSLNAPLASATETVLLSYERDFDTDWTPLGTVSAAGRTSFGFGWDDARSFSAGLGFDRIRFRLDFARDPEDDTKSPLVDSLVFHFIKVPRAGQSWTITVPLSFGADGWEGRSAAEIRDELRDLLRTDRFLQFRHGPDGATYRVRVARRQGPQATGNDARGALTVSLVEAPLPDGAV